MKKLLLCVAVAALATTANAQTTTLADKDVKVIGDGVPESCWKISNPSGPSDYFNNDYDAALVGDTVLAIAAMFCETNTGGAMSEIGFYRDNLAVDGTGTTPDLNAAYTGFGNPTGLPGTFCTTLVGYDVPDVTVDADGHAVVGLAPGDSAAWLCADTTTASQAGKSYFSTDGYSTPSVPFTVNWMLFPAVPITAGTLSVNGGNSATIQELDQVTFTLLGNPGISGEAWMLFVSDGFGNPAIAALPFVFFTSGGSSSVSGTYPCNVFVGGPVPFVAIWLDLVDTKPNGKGKIKVSNQVDLTINQNSDCTFVPTAWGQVDDGILDSVIWKVQNPAGSGDWFNTRQGTNAGNPEGIVSLTGVEVASWDFCGTGPNWQEVGIYPADLAFDATGGTPNIGSPITNVTGTAAAMGPAQSDWSYPATFYDMPDVSFNSTTDHHAAVKWNTTDSCVWLGSDTDGADNPGYGLPSSTSYFTSDGYATAAVQATNLNWMIKINWN